MKRFILILLLSFSAIFAQAQDVSGDELRIYKGAQIGEDGTTFPLNMHGNNVTNVKDPINLLDAVNKQWFMANMSLTQPLDSLSLTPLTESDIQTEYTMFADSLSYGGVFNTGLNGYMYKLGQATLLLYYNDNAYPIEAFDVLHLKSGAVVNGQLYPTPELADASDWEKTQGTLSVAAHPIGVGEFGFTVLYGVLKGGSTLGLTAGGQLWLSDDGSGDVSSTRPMFQSYAISIGGAFNTEAAPDGQIFVNITRDIYDTFNDGWDGAIRETFNFTTSSDGISTITGTLENVIDTKNLTLLFSDGFSTFDTTPAATLTLVAGTATVVQLNYVFIDKATKTLQTSTGGFPITEHAKIALIGVFDAASTLANGAIRNQNINDHIKKEDDNGHILHIAERLRQFNAEWDSGAETSLSGTPTNVYFSNTSGNVYQLHIQTFPVHDMASGDDIHVVNDPDVAYRTTTNLNDITEFSDGSNWNNEWSNLVVWGVCNKSGQISHLMVNLPSNGYNSESLAFEDRSNRANYNIPKDFKGVGFLLGRFTIRRAGGTFTYNLSTGYLDLRGFIPNNTAGSGGGGASGITTFAALTDTPNSYIGFSGQAATVTALEDGLEFTPVVTTINGDSPTLGDYVITSTANKVGENVTIGTSGTGVDAVFSVADDDNVIGNELQNLTNSKLNNDITIEISDGVDTTVTNLARTDFANTFPEFNTFSSGISAAVGTLNERIGVDALRDLTSGVGNIGVGGTALQLVTTGDRSIGIGVAALSFVTTGGDCVGVGWSSGVGQTTGDRSVFIGAGAGGIVPLNSINSTYIGAYSEVSSNDVTNENVFGYEAIGKGSNTVAIGNSSITDNFFNGNVDADSYSIGGSEVIDASRNFDGGSVTASGDLSGLAFRSTVQKALLNYSATTTNIHSNGAGGIAFKNAENATVASVSIGGDITATSDVNCVDLNYSGSLVPTSDKRVKDSINPLQLNQDKYLQLNPVDYYYNYDSTKTIHSSFLAQELEPLYPNLVKHSQSKVVIDNKIVPISSLDSIAQLNIKDEDRLHTIDPMSIIPLNTLATQKALIKCDSLQLIVDENKLQIQVLKSLLQNLTKRVDALEN